MPIVHFKKTHPDAKLPTYGTDKAACFDFYYSGFTSSIIEPNQVLKVNSKLIPIIPYGYSLRIHARSGLAIKNGIALANGEGIIDEDYRNEIVIALKNTSDQPFTIEPGMRIAQGELVLDVRAIVGEYHGDVEQVGNRTGGLGSTGLN